MDKTKIKIAEGGTATFNYTVKVTPNGYTDSGWTLGGKITVTNPNDWEDITVRRDRHRSTRAVPAPSPGGPDVRVPRRQLSDAGLHLHLHDATGSYSGKNTATATWDKAVYFTPTGSASGEAPM